MGRALGWEVVSATVRCHASGTHLAIAAPADELYTATEVNEWAWEQASGIFASGIARASVPPFDQLHPLDDDFSAVAAIFSARRTLEINPDLVAMRKAAQHRGIPLFADDDEVSLGAGAGSRTWPLAALPNAGDVSWQGLHDIPKVLVTGSNGKTTTVRLLATLINASEPGYRDRVGLSSTEGVTIGGQRVGEGDFSGPAGARLVLRDRRVTVAVLETARGGILRRGLAVNVADVAVITNISADHFGEYGIDSLDDLADVKLVVAHALGTTGALVLNADDPVLLARAASQVCRIALFALDDAHPSLVVRRNSGGSTCGLVEHQLWLTHRGKRSLLGDIVDMPLTLQGAARYNVANISAAVLAAAELGVSIDALVGELKRFGSRREDNPGRLERWTLANVTVLVDYAHNPDGLAMLLSASHSIRRDENAGRSVAGRVGLLLGQAGNRHDEAIDELAIAAATFQPDFVVLKEIVNMLRGRALGEVPARLKGALLNAGYPPDNIHAESDEVDGARHLLRWAQPGDMLVLPIHQSAAREELVALLDDLESSGWLAGSPLPASPVPKQIPSH